MSTTKYMERSLPAFVIPAYQAQDTIAEVVQGVRDAWVEARALLNEEMRARWAEQAVCLVVDDGSSDETAERAARHGAEVIRHGHNRGKGAALLTGLRWAQDRKIDALVSLDADGQHPPEEAVRLQLLEVPRDRLVLGVRDLAGAGAPRPNRFSNAFSNLFLSAYSRMRLLDTQCGLRRYPVGQTLRLNPSDPGYAFEAEIILRTARSGFPIEQEPVRVIYPPEELRVTHFHSVRDPARIVRRVLWTVATVRLRSRESR